MHRDPSLLPIQTEVVPDPFPRADPKSGITRRDELLRAAEESLATFVLEDSGVVLPAGTRFDHDSVCGAPSTFAGEDGEEAMHVSFAISAIEAAYRHTRQGERKAQYLGMLAELKVLERQLRGQI